jgi:hypothetical protein
MGNGLNKEDGHRYKEEHGWDVITVFEDQLQRDKCGFDQMIQKKEEDTERHQGPSP